MVGAGYYFDGDLVCRSCTLSGIWEIDQGDVTGWQRPPERHEGGTFILDSPSHGTFNGDSEGKKTATFRLRRTNEIPECPPIPR